MLDSEWIRTSALICTIKGTGQTHCSKIVRMKHEGMIAKIGISFCLWALMTEQIRIYALKRIDAAYIEQKGFHEVFFFFFFFWVFVL
jgi:hypothetical protein